MEDKRKRILQMLESGAISMDEALTLLEKLQSTGDSKEEVVEDSTKKTAFTSEEKADKENQEEQKQKTRESKKEEATMDDFLESLRRDFTVVGDRFMQFMQTAVEKVKDIDIESPFGKSFVVNHTVTKEVDQIDEFLITIPSGKVTVHTTEDEVVRAELAVKGYSSSESEEEAKETLLEKVLITTDDGKFVVSSELKIGQVDLDLYVPKKEYKSLQARLTNGRFQASDLAIDKIKVKSTNGAIRMNHVTSKEVSAETMNGLIYIEGDIEEVEAQSLNGAVSVTTTNAHAEKIEAQTVTGLVELYVPSSLSLVGKLSTSMGRIDIGLTDVEKSEDEDHLFQKTTHFYKELSEEAGKLRIKGKTKTGTVLIRYNA